MTEVEIFTLVRAVLNAAWPVFYPADAAPLVLTSFQPEAQGIETDGPTIYLEHVTSRLVGSLRRESLADPDDAGQATRRETQQLETTVQARAIWSSSDPDRTQDPFDLAAKASAILQSDSGLDALRAGGAGLLRVTEIRNPKFVNGSDQFEPSPNFDFVLTHKQVTVTSIPAAVATALRTYPV